MAAMECPLCLTPTATQRVRGSDRRTYWLCSRCFLVSVDRGRHLSPAAERAHYGLHENSLQNAGYVRFLQRLVEPLLTHLESGMRGLDFGSGPGPTLSTLLERHGFTCEDYDPLFADRPLRAPYDFVVSTECFEHFHRPAMELARIRDLLRPGGWLGVMTERWSTLEAFANWHYTRDPTHVSFYHARTFDFVCERFGFEPVWMDERRVVILRRT
jgi:SAM-dependent methyltransferase